MKYHYFILLPTKFQEMKWFTPFKKWENVSIFMAFRPFSCHGRINCKKLKNYISTHKCNKLEKFWYLIIKNTINILWHQLYVIIFQIGCVMYIFFFSLNFRWNLKLAIMRSTTHFDVLIFIYITNGIVIFQFKK